MQVTSAGVTPEELHAHAWYRLCSTDEGVGHATKREFDQDVVDRDAVGAVLDDIQADDVGLDLPEGSRERTERPRTIGQDDADEIRHPTMRASQCYSWATL